MVERRRWIAIHWRRHHRPVEVEKRQVVDSIEGTLVAAQTSSGGGDRRSVNRARRRPNVWIGKLAALSSGRRKLANLERCGVGAGQGAGRSRSGQVTEVPLASSARARAHRHRVAEVDRVDARRKSLKTVRRRAEQIRVEPIRVFGALAPFAENKSYVRFRLV